MSYILSAFTGLKYLGGRNDDDWTDRLHYQITANVLIALSILVSFKQFGGRPMECLLPDNLPDSWGQYAENYCWAQDTYYLSYEQDLTRKRTELKHAHIGYYKWVPFYLLLSALSFQIPSQIWRFLSCSSGIRLESLITQASDPKSITLESREQATRIVATYLENALQFQRRLYRKKMVPHRVLRFLNLPYKAFYMTTMYLLTKAIYVGNVFLQFVLLNRFLQSSSEGGWYGWTTLVDLMNGTQWEHSGYFPRDTLCDLQVRVPGNVQTYSIQCVLSINLFTEKLFVFLWFWYHFLGVITICSFLYWLVVCLPPFFPRWFILRNLELADMPFDPSESQQLVRKFVHNYLRTDGVFIIHMLNIHTGTIFCCDLVASLYKSYVGIEALVKTVDSGKLGKRWPSIGTLARIKSHISSRIIGDEIMHPPPPSPGLDQPDTSQPPPQPPRQPPGPQPPQQSQYQQQQTTQRTDRSISEVVERMEQRMELRPTPRAPKAAEEEYRDSDEARSGYGESPFPAAPRRRFNPRDSL